MSDPNPSKPSSDEREKARERNMLIGSHPPRFELHFHIPRFPNMSRAAWSSLVTECVGVAMLKLAEYGIERVEIYGDGIKVFVVVPNDPNIRLHFFEGHQEEIQRYIIARAEARASGTLSAQDELDRLTAYIVDHVEEHGSLETNADIVDSVIKLLKRREMPTDWQNVKLMIENFERFDSAVRKLEEEALTVHCPSAGALIDRVAAVRVARGDQVNGGLPMLRAVDKA